MPIGPVTNSHREISVTEPVGPALEWVKMVLFRPFDLGKWFTIGFCAWLAYLGESGGGLNGNFNHGNAFKHDSSGQPGQSFRDFYDQARDFIMSNLYWIVPVAVVTIIILVSLWLVILWLNSRGKFMFLHCVALNRAEVVVPWNKFSRAANSLFKFRMVLGLAGLILLLPLLAVIGISIIGMCLRGEPDVAGILTAVGFGILFLFFVILFALIQKFTTDFVVPVMFLRGTECGAAWREFYGLLSTNPGKFTLYILFQIVLGMAIGVIIIAAVLVTCCIAGCLMVIPYIGTVVLLPVLIFQRSYSLYFLKQYGVAYDVFLTAPPSPGLQPAPIV